MGTAVQTSRYKITGKLYDASINPPVPLSWKLIHIRQNINADDIATATTQPDGSFSVEIEITQDIFELYVVFEGDEIYSRSYAILSLEKRAYTPIVE